MKRARQNSSKAKNNGKSVYEKPELYTVADGELLTRQLKKRNENRRKTKKKKGAGKAIKTFLKVYISVFAVLIALLLVVMGFGLFNEGDLLAPIENGKINVLMLGVDEEGQSVLIQVQQHAHGGPLAHTAFRPGERSRAGGEDRTFS